MTTQQATKIQSAIADCNRFIAIESARAADLRPASVQKTLDHAVAHRAKLIAMLQAA